MPFRRWLQWPVTPSVGLGVAFAVVVASHLHGQEEATLEAWSDSSRHTVSSVRVAPGVQLEVLDWGGEGEALVFLTGLANNAHVFDDFGPRFTDGYHVIGVTRRGHGDSSWPDAGYDLATRVRDLRAVLDTLGIEQAILAGHSLAGDEMTRLAAEDPGRVLGLIYIDAAYDNSRVGAVFERCPVAPGFYTAFERLLQNPELYRRTQLEADTGFVQRVSPVAMAQLTTTFSPMDYGSVRAPALAVYHVPRRAEDILLNTASLPRDCVEAIQRYTYGGIAEFADEMEHATVVALQDTQHNIHLVTPDELERVMRRWLDSL